MLVRPRLDNQTRAIFRLTISEAAAKPRVASARALPITVTSSLLRRPVTGFVIKHGLRHQARVQGIPSRQNFTSKIDNITLYLHTTSNEENFTFPDPSWVDGKRVQDHGKCCQPAKGWVVLCSKLLSEAEVALHVTLHQRFLKQLPTLSGTARAKG